MSVNGITHGYIEGVFPFLLRLKSSCSVCSVVCILANNVGVLFDLQLKAKTKCPNKRWIDMRFG